LISEGQVKGVERKGKTTKAFRHSSIQAFTSQERFSS
jgi:hypothetical protein